ncbi:MAG: hypothetical protein QME60_02060 [Verrucomicrobiota bacterium]|nr:hypothetical protein [Verrucomicrobiota bacterium]
MKKIRRGFIHPSAAFTLNRRLIRFCAPLDKRPEIGDAVYGTIVRVGQHSSLENRFGRIHMIHDGTKAVFVFGNRYAPDFYEGVIPERMESEVDLLARSGVVGLVKTKNSRMKDPTRARIHGYVCDAKGRVVNTREHPLLLPRGRTRREPRARMILVCGTAMNSGKSLAASACCWALTTARQRVRASKITGTASLQDILHMNDAGASPYADFTYLGYPSTYLLPQEEVLGIFDKLDLKYANNPKNFWVVELADGINQRETAMLLASPTVRGRIHRLVFCANDAFGAIGGLRMLKEKFGLAPDALSGVCSSSPLHARELRDFTAIPIFNSAQADLRQLAEILLAPGECPPANNETNDNYD